MRTKILIKSCAKILLPLLCLTALASAAHAAAVSPPCIPGVPCIVNATANPANTPANETNASIAPNASKNESVMCDSDFMNQIYARSYLEAERETAMNEVVIRRPDSVLEYSCFDQVVRMTGTQAGPIFTETTAFQNVSVSDPGGPPNIYTTFMGNNKLDASLQSTVLNSLTDYLNDNFSHTFLGGTAGSMSPPGGGEYNCDFMNSVHFLAKCNDFATDDQFLTFGALAGTAAPLDPRQLPAACPAGQTTITNALISLANNTNYARVTFDAAGTTYLDRLRGATAGANACVGDPIPTGVMIVRADYNVDRAIGNVTRNPWNASPDSYEEKICVNPGCYYLPPQPPSGGAGASGDRCVR